jgi:hypothetical protein
MDNEKYFSLFPEARLNGSKVAGTRFDNFARNNHTFDIVEKKGNLITVGRGGQITGLPLDVLIIDDLYKDREEATSQTVSEKIWTNYNDVFLTRLHNDSQQLIMNTRWDEADLVGRLLLQEASEWEVIVFPAIKTADEVSYDNRKEGEALWPEKHSLERLLKVKEKTEVTFNSLYQQDPKPNSQLLVYPSIIVCDEFPAFIDSPFWGVDFGFTNDPTAVIKCGIEGDNAYYDECSYAPGIPMKVVKEILFANGYQQGQPVWCDWTEGQSNIAELNRIGVSAFPAIKGPGSVKAGIIKMKERNIHVTRRSVNMKLEQTKYQWVTYGTIITNEPEDKWNHCWDGARMATYTKFFR